jgi:hypothetical protein
MAALGVPRATGDIDFLVDGDRADDELARAQTRRSLGTRVQVRGLDAEDLIGLKVQSSTNNPDRVARDMDDIRRLLEGPARDLARPGLAGDDPCPLLVRPDRRAPPGARRVIC